MNMCVAYCQGEELSLVKPQVNVHALFLQSVLALRETHGLNKNSNAPTRNSHAWAAPPPRIPIQSLARLGDPAAPAVLVDFVVRRRDDNE